MSKSEERSIIAQHYESASDALDADAQA